MLCRTVTGKAKAAAAVASARQDVTLALIQPLPALLRKFQTEPIKAREHPSPLRQRSDEVRIDNMQLSQDRLRISALIVRQS